MPTLSQLFRLRKEEEDRKKKRRFFEPTPKLRIRDVVRELLSPAPKRPVRQAVKGLDFIGKKTREAGVRFKRGVAERPKFGPEVQKVERAVSRTREKIRPAVERFKKGFKEARDPLSRFFGRELGQEFFKELLPKTTEEAIGRGEIPITGKRGEIVGTFDILGAAAPIKKIGFTVGKKVLRKIAQTTNADAIFKILRKKATGISENVIRSLSEELTRVSNPQRIQSVINNRLQGLGRTGREFIKTTAETAREALARKGTAKDLIIELDAASKELFDLGDNNFAIRARNAAENLKADPSAINRQKAQETLKFGDIRLEKEVITKKKLPPTKPPAILTQQARKFKTAEEFVEAQPNKLFTGQVDDFDFSKISKERGVSLTPDRSFAVDAGDAKGIDFSVTELRVDKNANILEINKIPNKLRTPLEDTFAEFKKFRKDNADFNFATASQKRINFINETSERLTRKLQELQKPIQKYATGKGFDGVKMPGLEQELVIFNPNVLKTKQQLIDIFNQAKGRDKQPGLILRDVPRTNTLDNIITIRKDIDPDNAFTKQVLDELEASMPGQRIGITPTEIGRDIEFAGQKATFPDWVPSELRSTKLFKQVIGDVFENKIPKKGTKRGELFEIVQNEISERLGIPDKFTITKAQEFVKPKPVKAPKPITPQQQADAEFRQFRARALKQEEKGFTGLVSKLEAQNRELNVAPRALVQESQTKLLRQKPLSATSQATPPTAIVPGLPAVREPQAVSLKSLLGQRPLPTKGITEGQVVKVGDKILKSPPGLSKAFQTVAATVRKAPVSTLARNPGELKNIGGFKAGAVDNTRIFEEVYGKRFLEAERALLRPFDEAKIERIKMREDLADDLQKSIISTLKIKPRSKESGLIQLWGEKKITSAELKELSPKRWKDIMDAEAWFRGRYDELLDVVNASRKKIYPNNPDKIIPRRKDYFKHFDEFTDGYRDLFKMFSNPADISPQLAGISEFTKPKSKFLSFAQRRRGEETAVDAVGGYINWLESASYATHIDPQIAKFRNLAEQLRKSSTDADLPVAKQINGFIDYLGDFANGLAGKTGTLDRGFIKRFPGGRKAIKIVNFINNRWKANAVLGNVASSLNQILNVPQGIADAGPVAATKGLGRASLGIIKKDLQMAKSNFIKERYAKSAYERFDQSMLKVPKKFAKWMTTVLDEVGTKYIWSAEYEKALRQRISDPIRFADVQTRKMVAGRSVGEVPLLQQEIAIKLFAPFTLEVGNALLVMKDFAKKEKSKLITLFILNHLTNNAFEKVTGNGVLFDPIQAVIDASEENLTITQRGGRLAGEVIGATPGAAAIGAVIPEQGINIGGFKTGTREEIFGKQDPTRFGTGLPVVSGFRDPVLSFFPAFGGRQVKKTLDALKAVKEGASLSRTGRVRFPISGGVKEFALGPNSTQVAQFYFDNNLTPLGEKDSSTFKKKVKAGEAPEQVFFDLTVDRLKNSSRTTKDKNEIITGLSELLNIQPTRASEAALSGAPDIQGIIQKKVQEGIASGQSAAEIKRSVRSAVKAEILGGQAPEITFEDKKIKDLPTSKRIEAVQEKINEDPTIIKELVKKGIITENLLADMKDLTTEQLINAVVQLGISKGWDKDTIKSKIKKLIRSRALAG